MLYEPREDSYLLQKNVAAYAKGNVLDMGTGTGIQAKEALKKAKSVLAADINPEAVKHCMGLGITAVESDLFSNIRKSFDLIIFNPPYLPDDVRVKDIALDGGKKGYELIVRFLGQAVEHLNKGGRILLLLSSMSGPAVIQKAIADYGMEYRQIDSQKLDFEELYVYLISKTQLLDELHRLGLAKVHFFAKGHRGVIYRAIWKGQDVAVKAQNKASKARTIGHEAKMLEIVNRHHIGAKLLHSGSDFFLYRFVEGERIGDFIKSADKRQILQVIHEIFKQLHKLDKMGINKFELKNPYKHVLVGREAVLIDFERARHTERPANVTQFCSYISRISRDLRAKGITVPDMAAVAKQYAKDYNFKMVLDAL